MDRGVILAELAGLSLVRNLLDSQTESSSRRHHWTMEKKFARVKLLFEIRAMLVHQDFLFVGHVVRKGRPGRNELEEIMLFIHGNVKKHYSAWLGLNRFGHLANCRPPLPYQIMEG